MINTVNELGEIELSKGVFKDIVSLIVSKNTNFKSDKKDNSYIKVLTDNDKISIYVYLKAKKDIDVVRLSNKLQKEIKEAVVSTTNVTIDNININVEGFF